MSTETLVRTEDATDSAMLQARAQIASVLEAIAENTDEEDEAIEKYVGAFYFGD